MKKRILYIITQGEWGGAQRYVFDLATNLTNDFDVTVAVGETNGKRDLQEKLRITNYELRIVELRHLHRRISFWQDILAIFELARLYKKLKPDIVHLNSTKAGIIGSIAKLFIKNSKFVIRNSKLIYTVHGWVFNEPLGRLKKSLYRWLEKITARWKDKIIVLSGNDYDSGLRLGIKEMKLAKIPLGISQPMLLNRENAKKEIVKLLNGYIVDDSTWICTIANLYATKGLDVLVEAANLLSIKYKVSSIKFVIIGEGTERNKLEALISKYNLQDKVFLAGTIENAAEYLPAFDLFVLPSRKEGLPYTLLEAMSAGTPIIATGVGGIPSLIDDSNGLLVEPDNVTKLAESIIWAVKNPEEMKKRALRASEKVKEFTLEKMLAETKKVYDNIFLKE